MERVSFEMGRAETDWGRAAWATWNLLGCEKQSPSPSVWVNLISLARPEALALTRGFKGWAGLCPRANPDRPISNAISKLEWS
jgi:hypothetical protein